MLLQATCPRSLLTSGVPSTWADCYSSHFARSTGTATVSHQQLQWHFTALSIMNTLKNRVSSATSPLHTDSALQLLLQHQLCTLILHYHQFCITSSAHWVCTVIVPVNSIELLTPGTQIFLWSRPRSSSVISWGSAKGQPCANSIEHWSMARKINKTTTKVCTDMAQEAVRKGLACE